MKRTGCWMLTIVLLATAAQALTPSRDDKPPATVRAKFDALVKELNVKQGKLSPDINKAKGDERQKLLDRYSAIRMEYAEKIYRLAEDNPKDPAAIDIVFWVWQQGVGGPISEKADAKVMALVGELPVKELVRQLSDVRSATRDFSGAVLKRAEKEETDPQAADLLVWVAIMVPSGDILTGAVDRLLDKYPDHSSFERICQTLGSRDATGNADILKTILEKTARPKLKAVATMSLGQALAARTDALGDKLVEADKVAAEAEKYLTRAVELLGKDDAEMTRQAEGELRALRTLRIGKPAPEIAGADLDGKEFKLSAYRGKVVLLDFWGHWCPACVARYPYTRSRVKRLEGKPFALIGVNSDQNLKKIKPWLEEEQINWRSFWNGPKGPGGPIAEAWNVNRWPTLFLIDHKGVLRHKNFGLSRNEELDRVIDKLVAEAERAN